MEPNEKPREKGNQGKKSVGREILEWALAVIVPVAAVLLLHEYIFTFVTVQETSMLETLHDGQWMAVSRLHYRLVEPDRGDIVTCYFPNEGSKLFVKRVIGLPGDTISIEEGKVSINGEPLEEPYVVHPSEETVAPFTLAEDELFVMGDNRAVSMDSRMVGPIKRDDLMGFVMGAVFPFDEMRWFYGS